MPAEHRTDVIGAAVRFVAAQIGGPERVLTIHHPRSDGYCSGCTAAHARWPCVAAAIATAALTPAAHTSAAHTSPAFGSPAARPIAT